MDLIDILFRLDVAILILLMLGALWSIAAPDRRVWPPPTQHSWQYLLTWICFLLVFGLNAAILVLDWGSGSIPAPLRLFVGPPLIVIGGLLVSWGIRTLGGRNTSGVRDGLVAAGPYSFTRNPQYLGDIVLFAGLSLVANSQLLWVTHLLLSVVFLITPLAEEPWLEAQYGESYARYKASTSRFL